MNIIGLLRLATCIFAVFYIIVCGAAVAAEAAPDCSRFNGGYLGSYGKELVEQMHACAEQGHIKAIHKLSEIYIKFDGSEKKTKEAVRFYESALQKGGAAAAGALAEFFYSYSDGPNSDMKAANYAKLAYEMGDPNGSYLYAQMLLYGKGVPENIAEGMKIMRELSSRDNSQAKTFLNTMEAVAAGKPHVPNFNGDAPIKVSQPDYPKEAAMKRICGYGTAEFLIDDKGIPYDIRLVESYPDGIFDSSALKAAKRIRFKPAKEVAPALERRSAFTYHFVQADGCHKK